MTLLLSLSFSLEKGKKNEDKISLESAVMLVLRSTSCECGTYATWIPLRLRECAVNLRNCVFFSLYLCVENGEKILRIINIVSL